MSPRRDQHPGDIVAESRDTLPRGRTYQEPLLDTVPRHELLHIVRLDASIHAFELVAHDTKDCILGTVLLCFITDGLQTLKALR